MCCRSAANELAVPWQNLAEPAKSWVDLLKNAMEREQRSTDLEQELKQVRKAATIEKKKLEVELAEEKRKAMETTA
jgi:hypothetical protein